jgi:thioredoxin 1
MIILKGDFSMNYKLITLAVLCTGAPLLAELITVTDKNFDQKVLASSKPSIVKVSATWCSGCTVAKVPFKNMAQDNAYNDIQFVDLDLDNGRAVAKRYNISGVPTFLFVNKGAVVHQESGSPDANAFAKVIGEKIDRHLRTGKKKEVAAPAKPQPAPQNAQEQQILEDSVTKPAPSTWDSISNFFSNTYEKIRSYFR